MFDDGKTTVSVTFQGNDHRWYKTGYAPVRGSGADTAVYLAVGSPGALSPAVDDLIAEGGGEEAATARGALMMDWGDAIDFDAVGAPGASSQASGAGDVDRAIELRQGRMRDVVEIADCTRQKQERRQHDAS